MDCYKVIGDINELRWFFDHILVKPEQGESLYACHSVRRKHLTEEEIKNLGRTEMFHTEVSKPRPEQEYCWEDFLSLINKFQTNKLAYTNKCYEPFPEHALVTYMYLNPCDEISCAKDIRDRVNYLCDEMINAAKKHSVKGIEEIRAMFGTVSSFAKTCHTKNPSRKVWIDFDIDCHDLDEKGSTIIHSVTEEFFKKGNFALVKTAGGIHAFVRRESLKFNPNDYIKKLTKELESASFKCDEIIKNDNCMCSIPGTLQYGSHIVTIINKEDFN